ncbi:FIST signal transduction protein [Lewinella sp. IMCC34191]|uniref:FIST signal transduction protein n=1 Tax=Lewinella sp. IMCC34191 TaxID=2259172 RepID=UPI000E27FF6E|nr:FIST N-terminal domain-containing protein [Lewinella sp. IMCC34191]
MQHHQFHIRSREELPATVDQSVNLVLGFGSKALLEGDNFQGHLSKSYPNATVALCSSAGEIFDTTVADDSLSILAFSFDHTQVLHRSVDTQDYEDSHAAGQSLVADLPTGDLRLVFVLSDGSSVNGSELTKGIRSVIPAGIPITGGLAGDGVHFDYTLVGLNDTPRRGRIVAIGLYGEKLRVAHGSAGGWQPFGLERQVTRATGNELFEMDGKNALATYKRYLGKHADGLPGSALRFPLSIQLADGRHLVRTILGVDEEKQSMTFAGDIPEGSRVRFMMANTDRLTDAAGTAAERSLRQSNGIQPQVALLISCVGRKIVLGDRVDEEIEAVRDVFGPATTLAGYYSYGEIAPLAEGKEAVLYNQTMTITCLEELP